MNKKVGRRTIAKRSDDDTINKVAATTVIVFSLTLMAIEFVVNQQKVV